MLSSLRHRLSSGSKHLCTHTRTRAHTPNFFSSSSSFSSPLLLIHGRPHSSSLLLHTRPHQVPFCRTCIRLPSSSCSSTSSSILKPRSSSFYTRTHTNTNTHTYPRTRLPSSSVPKRDYSRRFSLPEGDGIVYAIIGVNVCVFGAWTYASKSAELTRFMIDNFTVSATGIVDQGKYHTLFTSMFSQMSFTHLLVNCVTLYFFGTEAAILLGTKRFLNLYLAGGLSSSLCCVAWPYVAPKLNIPASYRVSKNTPALGASGALNAVVAWSILMFPKRMVYVYMVLPVPAALVGVLFIAKDLSGLYQGGGRDANAGHLGGAIVGAAYYFLRMGRF